MVALLLAGCGAPGEPVWRAPEPGEPEDETGEAAAEETGEPETSAPPEETGDTGEARPPAERRSVTEAVASWGGSSVGGAFTGIDFTGDGTRELLLATWAAESPDCSGGAVVVPGDTLGALDPLADQIAHFCDDTESGAAWTVAAGDIDADGLEDLVISGWSSDSAPPSGGEVFLLPNPGFGTTPLSAATTRLMGPIYASAGASLAVGDVDADGLADVLVGAPWDSGGGSHAGAAYVLQGRADEAIHSSPDVRVDGGEDDNAGRELAIADLDGDGCGDLLVGAPGTAYNAGVTYLVLGPLASDQSVADAEYLQASPISSDEGMGSAISVGDVDGDGHVDALIGAPTWWNGGEVAFSGQALLFYGPLVGASVDYAELDGDFYSQQAGGAVALGDLDGDGRDDLVVGGTAGGANEHEEGGVWIQRGPIEGAIDTSTAELWIAGAASGDKAGSAVATIDFDGDGKDTVVVGAYAVDGGGAVYIMPDFFP